MYKNDRKRIFKQAMKIAQHPEVSYITLISTFINLEAWDTDTDDSEDSSNTFRNNFNFKRRF